MTKSEAIRHFGTQVALADALGIKQSSVSLWDEIIPALRQIQIESITGGELVADPNCYLPPSAVPEETQPLPS